MSYFARSKPREIGSLQGPIGWLALFLILLSALPIGGVEPVVWSLLAFVFFVLICVQLILDLVTGVPRRYLSLSIPALLFIGVLVWGIVQTLPTQEAAWAHPAWTQVPGATPRVSADPIAGYHALVRLQLYASAFWIVVRSAGNAARAQRFIIVIAWWSLLIAIYGLATVALGENPLTGLPSEEVTATFINRNSYATYAAFGVLANLAVFLHVTTGAESGAVKKRQVLRDFLTAFFKTGWIYFLGTLLCLAAVLFTESRAGTVSCLLALLAFFGFHAVGRSARVSVAAILSIAIIAFAFLMLSGNVSERILNTAQETPRFSVYPQVVAAILDRPWLGHGLGAFHDVFAAYLPVDAASAEWEMAHNSYLENAFELGLPAAGSLYLALLWVVVSIWFGNGRTNPGRVWTNLALAAAIGAGVHSLLDFSLQIPAVALLFSALLAIGWASAAPNQRS